MEFETPYTEDLMMDDHQDTTNHPWVFDQSLGDEANARYMRSVYTQDPRSALTESLAGIVWRWPNTPQWLEFKPDAIVDAVVSKALTFKAHPRIVTILSNAAMTISIWMNTVGVCKSEKQALELGLIGPPTFDDPTITSRVSKGVVQFTQATKSLLLMDVIFWLLVDSPPNRTGTQHPIYTASHFNEVELKANARSTVHICSRLRNWEKIIITSKDITTDKKPLFESVSAMELDEGLKQIIDYSGKAMAWGKVVRNIAWVVSAIRAVISPPPVCRSILYAKELIITQYLKVVEKGADAASKSAAAADRALLAVCGLSPILLLFPQTVDAAHRDISRYEWRMVSANYQLQDINLTVPIDVEIWATPTSWTVLR
jgi:hypothetical protein